jgi:hypothetical protein
VRCVPMVCVPQHIGGLGVRVCWSLAVHQGRSSVKRWHQQVFRLFPVVAGRTAGCAGGWGSQVLVCATVVMLACLALACFGSEWPVARWSTAANPADAARSVVQLLSCAVAT